MRVVGFTIVSGAERLEFPIVEAIRSVLPLTDEFIVNVDSGADRTASRIAEIHDARVRLVERSWDFALGGAVLARETQAALDLADGDWAVYVQADEVLHESGVAPLHKAIRDAQDDPRVEGLLVRFVHHYGGPGTIATGRHWYWREVRAVRLGCGITSHHEAQGFRVCRRRIRARETPAVYHHYGWSRPAAALAEKGLVDHRIYGRRVPASPTTLPWEFGLRPLAGHHPAVMRDWIAARGGTFAPIRARRWTGKQLRNAASAVVERWTGVRVWEYRNYVLV